jgi:serine/threonine protein kinase
MSTPEINLNKQTDYARSVGNASYELRNYCLHEQIGQEELATVYAASHLTLDRPVHVHLLRRTDWVSVSRFQLAARLAARLDHPNLLPVIDAGHDDDHGDYLVTPMLDARPLSAVLAEGPLDPLLVVRLATQLAAVLDYLHEHEVYHRDIQPANVLVTPEGVAYLTNLSLAACPDTPDLSSIDEADYLTPYSAPEQQLDQSSASRALDIYGLGALLYHMFSGSLPPTPGVEAPAFAHPNPDLREAEPVLQRMLDMEPAARFASVGDAVNTLRRSLRGLLDRATDDMEESRWEPTAEWMENPLETVIGELLDQEYLARSRTRADVLHRADAIGRLLNRWSRGGHMRRPALGSILQLEQIVSYNIYFYELRTLYETRTSLMQQRRANTENERSSIFSMPGIWDIEIPDEGETPAFVATSPQEMIWPNSRRVAVCEECKGTTRVPCETCGGKGTIQRERKVSNPDNSIGIETIPETCPTCRGYRYLPCPTCAGSGSLVEEYKLAWSRRVYLWKNTDDIEELPRLVFQQRLEPVYTGLINPFEGRWHSVAPLAELLREATREIDADTRIIAAELSIHGVPLTEVDYQLHAPPTQRLYIVGFDNKIVGTWKLLNLERIYLVVALAVLVLVVLGVIVVPMVF